MDESTFDALTRWFVTTRARRSLLSGVVGGVVSAALAHFSPEAAAGCKKTGKTCDKSNDCCDGARCKGGKKGKCRCKAGWAECNGDGLCRDLSSDAANCGLCGESCVTGCCAGGVCRDLCGEECCVDCFAFLDSETGLPIPGTDSCCAQSKVCNRGASNPADDRCCWPEEACIDGECCSDGDFGTVACGGTCCSSGSCCNGKCCGGDQVCVRTQKNKPRKCVSADRSCTNDGDCFEGEACWGGTCCMADRRCFAPPTSSSEPVCCSTGHYCIPATHTCCPNGGDCGLGKKVRIRV